MLYVSFIFVLLFWGAAALVPALQMGYDTRGLNDFLRSALWACGKSQIWSSPDFQALLPGQQAAVSAVTMVNLTIAWILRAWEGPRFSCCFLPCSQMCLISFCCLSLYCPRLGLYTPRCEMWTCLFPSCALALFFYFFLFSFFFSRSVHSCAVPYIMHARNFKTCLDSLW